MNSPAREEEAKMQAITFRNRELDLAPTYGWRPEAIPLY